MAKLSLSLRLRGALKCSSKCKIYLRVTQKGKTVYIDTGVSVGCSVADDLTVFPNFENNAVTPDDPNFVEKNSDLKYFVERAQSTIDRLYNIGLLSADQLRDIIDNECTRVRTYEDTAFEYAADKNDNYKNRIELSARYWHRYELDVIGDVVRLDSISADMVSGFSSFLKGMKKENGSNGSIVSESYCNAVLSIMKAVINWAIRFGKVSYKIHPFALTKIGKTHRDRCDIEPEDVRKLKAAILPANKLKWSRARDMWFLSLYMGGMNLKDMLAADWSGDSVRFVRSKTRNKISDEYVIYILPEARVIADKYIGENGRLDIGLKVDAIHNIGRALREIGEHYGMPANFKFMSARHTFAQFCMNMGVPDSITNYLMAHADGRGVIGYYNGVAPRIAKKFLSKIVDYMADPDKYEDAMVEAMFRMAR